MTISVTILVPNFKIFSAGGAASRRPRPCNSTLSQHTCKSVLNAPAKHYHLRPSFCRNKKFASIFWPFPAKYSHRCWAHSIAPIKGYPLISVSSRSPNGEARYSGGKCGDSSNSFYTGLLDRSIKAKTTTTRIE